MRLLASAQITGTGTFRIHPSNHRTGKVIAVESGCHTSGAFRVTLLQLGVAHPMRGEFVAVRVDWNVSGTYRLIVRLRKPRTRLLLSYRPGRDFTRDQAPSDF